MEYLRSVLNASQRAPLPLVAALALSTLVGLALLVFLIHSIFQSCTLNLVVLSRSVHCCPCTTASITIRENLSRCRINRTEQSRETAALLAREV